MMTGRREDGFTLIEALVALIILIAISVILYRGLSTGTRLSGTTDNAERALLVAKARLAALGIETPLTDTAAQGRDGGISWRIAMRPYRSAAGHEPDTETAPRAYWATVTASWPDRPGVRERSVSLTTLKLVPAR